MAGKRNNQPLKDLYYSGNINIENTLSAHQIIVSSVIADEINLLSAYYTKDEIEPIIHYAIKTEAETADYIEELSDTPGTIHYAIKENKNAIDKLNADETTSGSVYYAVKNQAQFGVYVDSPSAVEGTIQYAIKTNKNAIDVINGDVNVLGSMDYKINNYDSTLTAELMNEIAELREKVNNKINN